MSGRNKIRYESDPGSERSNRNGHSGKDRMAYGGLVYYDNALYTGPNPYKGIFSVNSDYPETDTYRRKKSRWLVALIVIVLLLVFGIVVFLGLYFGVMEKTDNVDPVLQTEPGKFQGTLKMNNAWDPKYGDHTTTEFTNLKTNLENQLTSMYQNSALKNDFNKVTVTGFSEGSIVGVYVLELKAATVQTQNSVLQITKQAVLTVQADTGSSDDLIKAVNAQEIVIAAVLVTTTLQPPTTTTQAQPTTTQAPDTTTQAPDTTTKAPDTTTQAPDTTTQAPDTTTQAPDTTTQAPDTTTQAPDTTTKAPDTTTKAPDTTTQAPDTTTQAPDTTTQAPDTTTKAPDTTTQAPDTTTQAPDTTTQAPDTTTKAQPTTTQAPYTTTQAPDTTTQAPDTTTQAPDTTTQAPDTTTQAPDTTTKAPDTTTQAPDTTTQAPDTTTQAPDTTTKAPDTTTKAPDTTTQAPDTTTQAPDTTTQAPDTTTQAPDTTTQAPDTTTQAPDTTTKAPDTTTQAPDTTTKAQPTTTQAPDTTTQAPDTTTHAPYTTTQAPDTTTKAPDTTTQAPDTTTQAPDTTTQAPDTTTKAPDTTTQAPDTTTQAPDTTTQAPDTTTKAPDTTTQAPDTTTKAQPTTTQAPDTTTQAPDTTTQAPYTTTQAPDTTTKTPDTTTQAPTTTTEAQLPSTPPPATTTPADQNPCVDYSLLVTIAIGCISKHKQAITAETTTEGKCRILLDGVITCVVSDIHTQYNKTCTEKEQHNIVVNNKDTIEAVVNVNPVLCLPTASCMNIRAITYYMPIICEDQIKLLRSSGNCSDFSDALKCYYYHTRIEYTCDLNTFMMAVTNNYTALVTDIGKPDLTCPVDTLRIDSSVKTSLCQDPDVMQVIVDMYCPHDLRDFIQASSDDKCMYGHNLVVCIVQQLTSVFKTTCMTDDIYQQMKIYQSQIIGVSNQLNIQSCQGTTPMTTETMTTTMTMTTTATIVVVKGEFEADLKINATWDTKYEDKNSTEYKDLTERFRNQTLSMYKNSSLEVEDIIIKEVSQGSVYFVFIIVFKKDAPNIDSLTPEMVIEATKKIIKTIQENPSDSFDLIQNTDVAEITIIQVTEILTKCDRAPYIKSIVEKYCYRSQQQLKWAIQPQEQCRIYLQMTGCVMYFTRTCSAKKITRTIFSNLNDFVENMPGFDPRTCYDEDNVVLPTMMPITAPVKSCAHPDVLSYILNFDCNYDAIPSHFEQDASTLEQCRFYWQSSACVYDIMKDNPVLQGQCSYDEITGVLQKYEAQIYRVHLMNVNSSVCFAYDRDPNKCSSMLYDPDMYAHFRDCFYNTLGIRMNPDVNTSAVTCVLYEESFECVYRYYQQKGLVSCNKAVLEKNVIWMTNSIHSVISKRYGQNFTEPDVVQTCIGNSSSDPDFGQSLCQDGVGILTANAECLNRYITAVKTRSLSVCSGLKNVFILCVMEKIAKIDNCSAAEMIASVIKEKDLVLTMSSGRFDISRCDEALSGDVCTTYNTSIIETAVQCAKTLHATANKANAGHAFCSAYNVYLRCVHIVIEKTTGKPCAISSLDVWMPYVTETYSNFTKEDAQGCTVTDDNDDDMCHDIKTLEDMALYSQCGVSYIQYFKTYPDCGATFEPYFKCLSEMFPSCDIEEIARKLMMSTIFTDKLQPGFDVLTCLKDDVSDGDICATYNISIVTTAVNCAYTLSTTATRENAGHVFCSAYNVYLSCVQYVIEEKTGKTCKKLSLDMWMPYLVPGSTNFTVEDAQACNVTDDGMCPDVRTLEVMATYSVCSGYVQILRVYPDCRTIIEPYFKCLARMFPACNVTDLAKTLMMSQHFADKLPTESTLLGCLEGRVDGSDICASYNANLTSALIQCGEATYGYITGAAPKYAFCRAYNVYLSCVQYVIEEKTGKTCKKLSLDMWMPYLVPGSTNFTVEDAQACNVTDDGMCPDVRTLEVMATYSVCSGYVQNLRVYPDCRTIIEPYFKCLARMFPACNVTDLAKTLMMSQHFADKLPTESTLLGCLEGRVDGSDICASYNANLTSALTQCGEATYGYITGAAPKYAFCRAYNVLVNCVHSLIEENTEKMCKRSSLDTWLPFSISAYFNVTSEEIQACNVTEDDVDDDVICNDVISIEEMAYYSRCGAYYSALTSNPDCGLVVKPYMECLVVLFPSCDAREIVKTLLTSPTFTAQIPQGIDILDCIGGADICRNYTDIVRNITECSMAVSGFKDKEPRMELLCRGYNVYVSCLEVTINKMGKSCEERSLRTWIPQYMERSFNLSASTVQTCNVTDKDPHKWCTDIRTLEMMALETPCSRDFEMLATNPNCLSAEKFLKCMEGIFPECEGKTLAQYILMSPLLRNKIPLDFDPMSCVTEDVTTTTSPTPTIAPDCNSVEYIKRFATVQCDAARNQLTLVQNSKQCGIFLDMVGCIVFNSMTCSAEEVVRTLNRDLWGIIGKNVTGFDSTTCYVSEDNIVFPTIVPTAPLIPCENPHVLRYILNYNCYYDGLENFMQGNMPLESCRIYWFSSACVYGYTKDNAMLGNCSYQDITDVLEKYDDELYLVRPVDVNASVCFEYNRDLDKCSTMLYDPTHYTLFYDCYSTLLTTRMNILLNSTGLDCLLYEENLECGFRFYEQIGLGWCDKMQFEKDFIWYINGLDAIMTKATGTPLGQPDVVERCIANVSMAPDFGMYLCRDIKGLILSNVLCIHSLQFSTDVCSTLRTEYIPCLMKKADDYKMMCSDTEDFLWNGIIRESDLIKHLTWGYVNISKCNTADKRGVCPPVTNHTGGGCVEECSADWQCTGNQKCCSNGCGHTCVDPSPEKMSRIFEITFRFDIPWKPEYTNGTGYMMLTTKISDQLRSMVYNSTSKDVVDYIQILNVRQGSVLVTIVIGFNQYLTPFDVRQATINLVKAVQEQPPSSSNDLIQKIDLSYIMVSERRDGPITTTTRPIAVEDCHSVTYIKQFVTSQCDSARNQLTKVENSKRCSVFLDLVGCVVFQSQKCTVDEVMMTLNKDLWGIIGQNITGFDPVTCYGSGSQIVLPTIMPLNTTLKPCMHPDVLSYVLKYNCYYTALEQQMNGDTELESCRFYWYSSSCVYGALKDNAKMGNCSYQEIEQVLQMYENQLYRISPNNVNASVCFDYDRSMERCSTFLYDPYFYHYFFDCYSSGYTNRNNWALDVSGVGCMIYEESYECMYRFYKQKGLGSCDRMQFEEDVIWSTNSMNDIMSQATGTPPDSPDTVKICIANVSHAPDFGHNLCEDGPGLIMADTVCLIYLQYSPDQCSGIKTTYLPCLLRKTVDYQMACSEDMAYASIMKESDLILKLTMNMVDFSKCDQDEDKVGDCPSVRNDTGICLQNCTYDKECAGNQKCCSNGCGHMCVEPVSKVFKMTFRFNITWDSDYGEENSTKHVVLTADILNQINTMVANSQVKDSVEWLKIIGIREGSVHVDFVISLITELTADDLRLTTVMLVQTVQANTLSPLDKIKSINTDDIHVTIYKDGPITTTTRPIDGPITTTTRPIGDQDEDKVGECPSVRNDTGICLQNCTYDKECAGNQKCCSNGCGHMCVEPVSKVFKMTFRFNITWDSDYGEENSTKHVALTADILNQINTMVANSQVKDLVEWLKIIGIREGSVHVDFVISLITELTADDLRLSTVMLVQTVQANPLSPLDKIKSINTDDIHVTIYKDDVCTDVETFRTITATTCQSQIDQFSSSDNLITFCVKLHNLDTCIKGALPTYGCPNEIAAETYPKLLGLLDQLLGFSASSNVTQCVS